MADAAKAGMMGMMYTAVKELARHAVRVNAMWPIARTDMTQPLIDAADKSALTALVEVTRLPEEIALGLALRGYAFTARKATPAGVPAAALMMANTTLMSA